MRIEEQSESLRLTSQGPAGGDIQLNTGSCCGFGSFLPTSSGLWRRRQRFSYACDVLVYASVPIALNLLAEADMNMCARISNGELGRPL
jgi:hypothetical protein